LIASDTDLWHFLCDEQKGLWTWKRVSLTGQEVASSAFSFASFNVCVADAERAGFVHNTGNVRRVHFHMSGRGAKATDAAERRKRSRDSGA
jgi:hypothetical protein